MGEEVGYIGHRRTPQILLRTCDFVLKGDGKPLKVLD